MKKMTRLLSILLALSMLLAFAACGGDQPAQNSQDPVPVESTPAEPENKIEAGTYTFTYVDVYGDETAFTVTTKDTGKVYVMYEGTLGKATLNGDGWTDNGDGTFTTAECVGEGPQIAGFWENNSIVWQLLNDNCAVPVKADDYATHVDAHGIPAGEASAASGEPIAAGEYTFMEATPFGEMKWVVTLNEDGTSVFGQPENEGMGCPTWTAVWTDNGDGTFTTAECVGDGPQIASFWSNNAITWIDNGDGTVTPVGYTG